MHSNSRLWQTLENYNYSGVEANWSHVLVLAVTSWSTVSIVLSRLTLGKGARMVPDGLPSPALAQDDKVKTHLDIHTRWLPKAISTKTLNIVVNDTNFSKYSSFPVYIILH